MEEHDITSQLTSSDKSVRGKICYPLTQPIWWLAFPARWALSWCLGLIFGQSLQRLLYQKILTPANMLTGFRIWLLTEAIGMFFGGVGVARQAEILLWAIITDFLDGPLARNNNEVTELGTYLDHIGDWGVVIWVMFLTFWYETISLVWLLAAFTIIPILFVINLAKFRKFYDSETSWIKNVSAFAAEELQTNFWGRIQFVCLCIGIFGALLETAAADQTLIFNTLVNSVPADLRLSITSISFALYFYLSGYSTREAIDYSEAQVKKFREKLRKIKNGSPS